MPEHSKEAESGSSLPKWTRLMFLLSITLLGLVFSLQGLGILSFSSQNTEIVEPILAGGLRCDEPVWNFGAIDSVKNPKLSHEFVLVNASKETVTIQKVHSTCGCMVVDGYDKVIGPGKSTNLKVDVTLPPTPGTFQKSLAVQLAGQKPAVLPLEVVGEQIANSSMFCIPAKLNFGAVLPGETKERTVQIFRHDLSPILFEEAIGSDESIACELEPAEKQEGHKAELRVSLTANESTPKGLYEGFVTVKTKHSESAELKIPVSAIVE